MACCTSRPAKSAGLRRAVAAVVSWRCQILPAPGRCKPGLTRQARLMPAKSAGTRRGGSARFGPVYRQRPGPPLAPRGAAPKPTWPHFRAPLVRWLHAGRFSWVRCLWSSGGQRAIPAARRAGGNAAAHHRRAKNARLRWAAATHKGKRAAYFLCRGLTAPPAPPRVLAHGHSTAQTTKGNSIRTENKAAAADYRSRSRLPYRRGRRAGQQTAHHKSSARPTPRPPLRRSLSMHGGLQRPSRALRFAPRGCATRCARP